MILRTILQINEDRKLKHSDIRIFLALVKYNGAKRIFPSLDTISKTTGIKSIPDISKGLQRLKENGYIEIQRRRHQSNLYTIINSKEYPKPKAMKPRQSKPESKANPYTWVIVEIYKNMTGAETSPAYAMIYKLLKLRSDLDHLRASLLLMSVLKANEDKTKHEKFAGIIYNSYREASYNKLRERFDQVPAVKFNEYEVLN